MKKKKESILKVYKEKNLNAVYHFLKKNNIKHKKEVLCFGLHTNKKAQIEKVEFLKENVKNEIHLHYYSVSCGTCKTNGFSYNQIRGLKIILL